MRLWRSRPSDPTRRIWRKNNSKRAPLKHRRSKHLCADAGYLGKAAMAVILAHGDIPHVVSRKSEAGQKKRDPAKKARRWVVEACHGWQQVQEAASAQREA